MAGLIELSKYLFLPPLMSNEIQSIAIVSPCFNEQGSILSFLKRVEDVAHTLPLQFYVIIIDDCSQDNTLELLNNFKFSSENIHFHVLSLLFNVGHQGAIYQGILYSSTLNVSKVIIMDSDGEDDPEAIKDLLEKTDYSIVEVKRGRRKESILFKLLYLIYKIIFRFITGKNMDYGNYCMIGKDIVDRISKTAFIHLPAYLLKQKASKAYITYDRKKRIDGKSKMGINGLLIHAFKSLIEFSEDLLMLFLKLFIIILIVLVFLVGNIFYQKFIAKTAILGWFSTLTVGLMNLAMLCFGFFIIGILLLNLMHQQNNQIRQNIYKILIKK